MLESSASKPPDTHDLAPRISALEEAEKKRQSALEADIAAAKRRSSSGKAEGTGSSPTDGGDEGLRKELDRVAKLAEESGARLKAAEDELKRIAAQVEQHGAAQKGQMEQLKVRSSSDSRFCTSLVIRPKQGVVCSRRRVLQTFCVQKIMTTHRHSQRTTSGFADATLSRSLAKPSYVHCALKLGAAHSSLEARSESIKNG